MLGPPTSQGPLAPRPHHVHWYWRANEQEALGSRPLGSGVFFLEPPFKGSWPQFPIAGMGHMLPALPTSRTLSSQVLSGLGPGALPSCKAWHAAT